MMRNLDVAVLRAFVTVAQTGSMTGAAEMLNLTQGAISQQIKRLETQFERALFERTRKGLHLTQDGEKLLRKAQRMLVLNDEIWQEMRDDGYVGKLTVGIPYDLVGSFMRTPLRKFCDQYPGIELSLRCHSSPELKTFLQNGEVDIALIEEPVGQITGDCLLVAPLVWVGAKSGKAQTKRPLPVSLVSRECAFRPAVIDGLDRAGIAWRSVFESGNIEATAATVRSDLSVTAFLVGTIPDGLEALRGGDELPELPKYAISLMEKTGAHNEVRDVFAEMVRSHFHQM
ncbi:LysR family transcriptional regulator [Thalassospira sp.]|uniref:LysR family transcriptional regulator n=1 Tax=Thalassospira sp. TaxID=1912094 RepID=UPI000C4A8F5D|nr:LysR family transcriptional regulator [Thalassospira sp.]MBC07917.1 LysR family transcriptional regulator [Thalassospira sp.]|tara:strand:- start:5305 stop:6162 length:858 start_codon:yes stop_codon:yes gene_type:complete